MRIIQWIIIALILVGCATPKQQEVFLVNQTGSYQEAAVLQVELGLAYLQQGEIERGKSKLLHALELAPHIAETHSGMAYFFEKIGDYTAAKQEYLKALRFKTRKSEAALYNNYATFLCRQKNFVIADHYFQRAASYPYYAKSANVHENRGACAMENQDYKKADKYLRLAIAHNPNNPSALLRLIRLKLLQHDVQEADRLSVSYTNRFSDNIELQELRKMMQKVTEEAKPSVQLLDRQTTQYSDKSAKSE